MKRRILCRPVEAVLPLALAMAALLGQREAAVRIFMGFVLARVCTLAMPFAFRRAAGQAMSASKLRGDWTCALLATLAGGGALFLAADAAYTWLAAAPPSHSCRPVAALGLLLALKDLFGEHLRANGQRFSANLLECLVAVLFTGAVFMGGELWWLGAGALALMIALVAGIAIAGNPLRRPGMAPLREIPGAAARELLYAAVALFLYAAFAARAAEEVSRVALACALLGGQAIFRGAQSAFRRSRAESALIGWGLTLAACLLCACALFRARLPASANPVNSGTLSPVWGGGFNGVPLFIAALWGWGALAALWTGACLALRPLCSLLAATVASFLPVACWAAILPLSADFAQWICLGLWIMAIALRLSDLRELLLRARARSLRRR